MKLNHAPQAGLRRHRPEHRRQIVAFWAGIVIVVAFELILMAKGWSVDDPVPAGGAEAAADDGQDGAPLPAAAN